MKVACDYILEIHQLIVDYLTNEEIENDFETFTVVLKKDFSYIYDIVKIYPIQYKEFVFYEYGINLKTHVIFKYKQCHESHESY